MKIVKPFFQKAENDAIAQYRQSSGTGLTSADIREIVPAAVARTGRHALHCRGEPAIGEHSTGKAVPSNCSGNRRPTSEDLLEIAAIQTYLNGGSVFILPPEKMPEPEDLVAVFRY